MNKVKSRLVLELLRRQGKISPAQFEDASVNIDNNLDPFEILINDLVITKKDYQKALVMYSNAPYVDLDSVEIKVDVTKFFGLDLLGQYKFIPIYQFKDGLMIIGAVNPTDPLLIQILYANLGDRYQIVKVGTEQLEAYLNIFRAAENTRSALRSIQNNGTAEDGMKRGMSADVANSPAVRFIDSVLEEAVKIGASDIHIEPSEDKVAVRYRIDGDLHEKSTFDINFFPAVSTRIKILADIDIAEKRIPQDGHITQFIGGEKCDFRVSTLPTIHGEKFVIRVLDQKLFSMSLAELNFSKEVNETIDKILHHPHGIILLTGPTGSGKTTTLYSFLRELNKPTVNIVTIEDPVEYSFKGINQIQVNNKAELTFAASLRSILRQDPDIIMVGEIRDEETAQIAIRAAITGHLVLSTLHTNEAPGAVTRLIDMGVPSYLVSDALVAVISQRLLKRLCPHCRKPVSATAEQKKVLGLKGDTIIYEKNGCPYCNNTGYKGRLAVHEIMYLNDELRDVIAKGDASIEEIRDAAIKQAGMKPIFNAAKNCVLKGETAYNDLISMIVNEERENITKK